MKLSSCDMQSLRNRSFVSKVHVVCCAEKLNWSKIDKISFLKKNLRKYDEHKDK